MKTNVLIILLFFGLSGINLFGHEQVVHQAITVNAAAAAYAHSPAYVNFANVISSDRPLKVETNLMSFGSYHEDDAGQDAGGKRSLNHFYDPLDTHYNKGLSDYPPDLRITAGTNSFIWASVSNGLGFNFKDPLRKGSNLGTSNIWSWQNARGYE